MSERVDAIVIGSGPGGEGAAMQLVKNGKKVVLFERHSRVGGGCTHWGTIPSKALRFSIYRLTEALNNPLFEDAGVNAKVTVADLRKSAQAIIDKQVQMRGGFYGRNDVKVVQNIVKETITGIENGKFVAFKEVVKKAMPEEYKALKELKEIILEQKTINNI